jgi:hypothetical protein
VNLPGPTTPVHSGPAGPTTAGPSRATSAWTPGWKREQLRTSRCHAKRSRPSEDHATGVVTSLNRARAPVAYLCVGRRITVSQTKKTGAQPRPAAAAAGRPGERATATHTRDDQALHDRKWARTIIVSGWRVAGRLNPHTTKLFRRVKGDASGGARRPPVVSSARTPRTFRYPTVEEVGRRTHRPKSATRTWTFRTDSHKMLLSEGRGPLSGCYPLKFVGGADASMASTLM